MKTQRRKTTPVNHQVPRVAPATAMRIETLQLIKTRLRILLLILCSTLATTVVFGQQIYTWTGAANGTNLSTAGNWTTNGTTSAITLPSGNDGGSAGDTVEWNGVIAGNLLIDYFSPALPSTGFGTFGITLHDAASQVNSVQIYSTASPASPTVGVFGITIDSGAGPFVLGDTTANNLKCVGRPAGAVHSFVNNSAYTAIINPSVEWQAGGGNGYTYDFSGSGNWAVTNYLMPDNGAFSPMTVQVDGPGTVFWAAGKTGEYNPNSSLGTVTINGGVLVIESSGLFTGSGNQAIGNSATLEYDAAAQSQTLSGVISGSGNLQVNNGTLTLTGESTYTGTNLLTGGELIVNSSETNGTSGPLGVGGTITFNGGTLGFAVNNVFDYSFRFDTNAGQAYSIDTGGQNVAFTNATGLIGSGNALTKLGSGTLTLAGTNSYTGTTTVSVGRLVFQGPMTGTGSITLADSAALGVTGNGTQVMPGTLTVGTSSGATLEFNSVNSTTLAPLAAGTISTPAPITINVNSGALVPGQSYPLFTWTSGSAPGVNLAILNGFIGNLSTNGNTIQLNVTATAYTWTGANNGSWDLSTANNWLQNGGPVVFANGGPASFDDTATGATNVTINALLLPTTVTVNNNNKIYSIASSSGNDIGGSASLLKSGSGLLTLSGGANTYTGVTTISGGTLTVSTLANGGSASDVGAAANSAANLVINGGTLQYTGAGASIDRLFTLSTSGGTIDNEGGALSLTNTGSLGYSGNGPRTLTLTGTNTATLAAPLVNNGGATTLIKDNTGTWVLAGNNTYSGLTTINNGELQIGSGGGSGSLGNGNVADNSSIDFNRTGTLTVSGAISGTGSVTNDGSGTVILAANNSYTGGTTINAGTLQVGNGGAAGTLASMSPVTNNGTLIFNTTGSFQMIGNGLISGTGQVMDKGSGLIQIFGANTYTGPTTVASGAQLQLCTGESGSLASSVITNNGTLIMDREDFGVFGYSNNIVGSGRLIMTVNNGNAGDATLAGNNTYTNITYIYGGGIILGDGVTPGAGTIISTVVTTNNVAEAQFGPYVPATIEIDHPENYTFTNLVIGNGFLTQLGPNVTTITANNTYSGGTTISNGVLQVGAGGTTGWIGANSNGVIDDAALVFDRSDTVALNALISGTGSVVQYGSGTLTLSGLVGTNVYTGSTTVSNGTLVINNTVGGDVDVSGGTLISGGAGSVSTLNIGGNMNIMAGTVVATLNKSLSPSNTVFSVAVTNIITTLTNAITYSGGTLKLVNYGPALVAGDKFVLFSQPVVNGAAMTIAGPPGATVANNLAVDGSVSVATVSPPPTLTATVSGGQLHLSWPASWTGVHVQVQTNSLARGLGTNWVTIPGTDASNNYSATLNSAAGTTFYRLAP